MRPSQHREILQSAGFDPKAEMLHAFNPSTPWDGDIATFATHQSFCGEKLYPRQITLLKLIYLQTEMMTDYDIEVIEEWRNGFFNPSMAQGVQPDIWERVEYLKNRGYRRFPHIEAVIGRRGSKGKIGGILGAETMAYLYSLDDWQAYYGISPGKDGYLSVVATGKTQATKFQFADIREAITNCEYLQRAISKNQTQAIHIRTPADLRRIAYLRENNIPADYEIATLRAVPMSSQSSTGRGATGFANFYDEFAHMLAGSSSRSGEEVYEAYQPSLDQFGKDSLTYIPSSPFTQTGRFYSLYKEGSVLMASYDDDTGRVGYERKTSEQLGLSDGDAEEAISELTANPEMLIVQLPSWGLYKDWQRSSELVGHKIKRPIQSYDDRMKRLERSNPEKFKVERASQFASVMNAWLDPQMVDAIFDPWEGQELKFAERGTLRHRYYMHCDPALSGDNFALAIGHSEDAPADEHGDVWPHAVIDYMKVWKPSDYEDGKIDYIQVLHEISDIMKRFPSMVMATFDQWQNQAFIPILRRDFPKVNVTVENFTASSNLDRMERFKTALNLGWVHAPKDNFFSDQGESLLEMEMKFLQKDKNKIDHPGFGPVTSKDLFDCVNVVTDRILKDALDIYNTKMLGLPPSVGSTNVNEIRSGRAGMGIDGFSRNLAQTRNARDVLSGNRESAINRKRGRGAQSVPRSRRRG